ncbi:MAG: ATP-binding protein [Coriobacteriales bacterium]|jgi:predicted AAA+ superfamily ATPase|nr:ATP-binding protein [Coriobacteriales bacterium]
MLRRKIYDELLRWKALPERRALIVSGARQVGKTFIINAFVRDNYAHVVFINFEEMPRFKQAFEGNLDTGSIISQLSVLLPDAVFQPGATALVLDEIQSCPQAITALKFFTLDGRFDVIATDSLLGMSYKEVSSFPVGYTDRLELFSLDFEEFLWANKVSTKTIEDLREHFETGRAVPEAIHSRMLEIFRTYIVVGGMPAVVDSYVRTQHFGEVLRLQRNIVRDYTDDIAKYAEGSEKTKARACFLSIPQQLARDYKKFRYSTVDKNGSSRKYAGSLMWLYDAGVINFCHNLGRIELPLEGNVVSDAFKVYMRDTGLLVSMLENGAQADVLAGNLGIYKGALYENIVADIFGKAGKRLYYYEYRSFIEMDFIIQQSSETTAVEVKSAEHTKSKSLNALLNNYGVKRGIKLSTKNVGLTERVGSYPLYMAMFL